MKKSKILVVEDEAIIAMGIQGSLENLGYDVVGIAYHGEEALEKAARYHPDMVLMDVTLRGPMNGIETANQMRLKFDIPVIYLSAMTDEETIKNAERSEPYGFIPKPVSDEVLGITIFYALNKYDLVKQLRVSEAQYRELFETSLDGIVVSDAAGVILKCNPAFGQLIGYDPAFLAGKSIAAFSLPELLSEETKWVQQIIEQGCTNAFKKEYIHSSGKKIPANVQMWARKNGQGELIGFWSIIQDLSHIQASENALMKSERVLQALISQSPNGISMIDGNGQVLSWNHTMEQMTGLPAQETIGKWIWEIQFSSTPEGLRTPSLLERFKEMTLGGLTGSGAPWMNKMQEHLIQKADGTTCYVEEFVFPVQTPDQTLYASIAHDITARKLAEDKILRKNLLTSKLVDATQRLNNELELSKLYDAIYHDLIQIGNIGVVGISRYDPISENFVMDNINGQPTQSPIRIPLAFHQRVVKQNQILAVFPEADLPDGEDFELLKRMDVRSLALITLTHKKQLIGTIFLGSVGRKRQFDEDEEAFLATYGNHVASAIDRALIFEESRQRSQELEMLGRISSNLRQATSRKEMLPILLTEAISLFSAAVSKIFVFDRGDHIIDSHQMDIWAWPREEWFVPGEPLWQKALAENTVIIHSEILDAPVQPPDYNKPQNRIHEKVVLSLLSNQSVTGFLVLGFADPINLDENLKRVALALAEIAGNALQRSGVMDMLEHRVADRTRELSTLYELTLLTNEPINLEQMLRASLERVLNASEAQAAGIYQYDKTLSRLTLMAHVALPEEILSQSNSIDLSDEVKSWLENSTSPRLIFADTKDSLSVLPENIDFGTIIYVPVRFEKIIQGLLCILWQNVKDLSAENISLIRAVAERLGSAIQNRSLSQRAEQVAVLEERQRLARELHDSVTQSIFSLTLLSEAGMDLAAHGDQEKLTSCLQEMQRSSIHTLQEMRLLLFELRPPKEKGLNLIEMLLRRLESVERRSRIRVEFKPEGELALSPHQEEELYRIINEALNNSLKHSGSEVVKILLQSSKKNFTMVIEDEGCGFDPQSEQQGGIGLESMRERIHHLGGELVISSQLGKGTRIRASIKM